MSVLVRDLFKQYGVQQVLDAVSFEARPGRVLGLLGPNGAGKSTTMKILAGSTTADRGEVRIFGEVVDLNQSAQRNRIGYLPEHNPVYLDMYVQEFLHHVAGLHQLMDRNKKVELSIQLTGLGPEQHKKIRQLSKGYRQRVGLAQAIIHNPSVLILDEPTTGLDPNQLIEVRQLIRQLGQEKTVILSTHIMQEVEAVCDDVVIMHQGRIVAACSMDQLEAIYGVPSVEALFVKLTGLNPVG